MLQNFVTDLAAPAGSETAIVFDTSDFYTKVAALVPGIIYVFNHQTQANEYSNHSIASLLGYSPDEILAMGENLFSTIIHPEDLQPLSAYLASLSELNVGDVSLHEYRAVGKSGEIVWLRSNDAVFQMSPDGTVLRHIGCASDVTFEKNRELQLEEDNAVLEQRIQERTAELAALNASLELKVETRTAQLQSINDELEQLTYIATHDLKGPISNMSQLTAMLMADQKNFDLEHQKVLGWMKTSLDQANGKLEALVSVAHARSADLGPLEEVSLADFTKAACGVLAHEIEAADALIVPDFKAAPTAQFPSFEMASLLENLIGNALKYAVSGRRAEISIRSDFVAGSTRLKIRDNGTGLNLPRDVEKVFGLFKRAHIDPPGSGMALYSIKKMLERFGGGIAVESSLGEWTEFTVTFPPKKQVA